MQIRFTTTGLVDLDSAHLEVELVYEWIGEVDGHDIDCGTADEAYLQEAWLLSGGKAVVRLTEEQARSLCTPADWDAAAAAAYRATDEAAHEAAHDAWCAKADYLMDCAKDAD